MIFYFSGTGNSRQIALDLAERFQIQAYDISQEMKDKTGPLEYWLEDEDLVGLVYPIHAWGPPQIVLDFISRLGLSGGHPYVFSLATCASEEGKSSWLLSKALKKRKIDLNKSFTLIMPNNYMLGRGLEPKEVQDRKLADAQMKLDELTIRLARREGSSEDLFHAPLSWLMTLLVNPLFRKFALDPTAFYVTEGCTKCGVCVRACPIGSISLSEAPVWAKSCTMCFSCINRCPVEVIQYGKRSINKGRYVHPEEGNDGFQSRREELISSLVMLRKGKENYFICQYH